MKHLGAEKLADHLAGPALDQRTEKSQRESELSQHRRHRHFGGASRSVLALHGQPEPRLRNPSAVNAFGPQLGKNSSFRLGHNLRAKAVGAPDKAGLLRDGRV